MGIECYLTDSNGYHLGNAEHAFPYQWLVDLALPDKQVSFHPETKFVEACSVQVVHKDVCLYEIAEDLSPVSLAPLGTDPSVIRFDKLNLQRAKSIGLENTNVGDKGLGANQGTADPEPHGLDPRPVQDVTQVVIQEGILYLANTVRPNLSYATGLLTRFANAPTNTPLGAGMNALKYLAGIKNLGLVWEKVNKGFVVFGDSYYSGDSDGRKSTPEVRDEVENGAMEPRYVATSENIADFFTKVLPKVIFAKLREMAGIK